MRFRRFGEPRRPECFLLTQTAHHEPSPEHPLAAMTEMTINWFLRPPGSRSPEIRLICLPYAGGSAAVYRSWWGRVDPDVEVVAVQLAGRGWRLREPPASNMDQLADDLADAVLPSTDVPVAVFGHSMGAWLGLELVRRLEKAGVRPMVLFASGRQAPQLGCTQPGLTQLDDGAFVAEVQTRYGGIPLEIASEPELLELLLPALRADIAMLEAHQHRQARPVETPIHALVGHSDSTVSQAEITPWARETSGPFSCTVLPGGHFYFQPDPSGLLKLIRRRLKKPSGAAVGAPSKASW